MTETPNKIISIKDYKKVDYGDTLAFEDLSRIIKQKPLDLGYTEYNDMDIGRGGGNIMQPKEYIDVRIDGLEESINQRFSSQEKLFSEKLNTLTAKIDGQHDLLASKIDSLSEGLKKDIEIIAQNKIEGFQTSLDSQKKENRNFTWMVVGVAVAAATLITSLIQFII